MNNFRIALQQPKALSFVTKVQKLPEKSLGEETGIPREIENSGAKSGSAISMEENVKITPWIIFRYLYYQTRSYPQVRENAEERQFHQAGKLR